METNEPDWAHRRPSPENDNLESLAQALDELASGIGDDDDDASEAADQRRSSY